MAGDVVLEGEFSAGGVGVLLRDLEARRISGVLRFEHDGAWREVALLAGALVEPASAPGEPDPLEALLDAQSGRYEVRERLPSLPVSQGDARTRSGSLAVHIPADLMGWCERAGLSGRLTLTRADERAEARYERGELVEIQLVGRGEGDLSAVFAWESGTFHIEAELPPGPAQPARPAPGAGDTDDAEPSFVAGAEGAVTETRGALRAATSDARAHGAAAIREGAAGEGALAAEVASGEIAARRARGREDATVPLPHARARRRDDTGQRFLRVVETTLGAIVDEAEKRRAPARSSPPQAQPAVRAPSVPPPARAPREATVRIVYVTEEIAPLAGAHARRVAAIPSQVARPRAHAAPTDRRALAGFVGGLVLALAALAAFAGVLLRAR